MRQVGGGRGGRGFGAARKSEIGFVYNSIVVVGGSVLFPKLYPPCARSSERMPTINEEYSMEFGFGTQMWYYYLFHYEKC